MMNHVIKATCMALALFIHNDSFGMQALSNSLFKAIESGMVWRVNKLIEQEPSIIHMSNDRGYTPLSHAVWYENVNICTTLLDLKADPNKGNRINITPLHTAKNNTIVELLLKAGADPNAKDEDGRDALYWAVLQLNAEKVKLLLKYGAHVEETLMKKVETDWRHCPDYEDFKDLIVNAFYEQQKLQQKEDVSVVPNLKIEYFLCMKSFTDTLIKQISCNNNHKE